MFLFCIVILTWTNLPCRTTSYITFQCPMRGDYSWLSCHNGATSIQQIHHHYPRVTLSWVLRILDPHTCHNGLRMEWNQIDPVTFNTTSSVWGWTSKHPFYQWFFLMQKSNSMATFYLICDCQILANLCLSHDRQTKLLQITSSQLGLQEYYVFTELD